MRGVLCSKRHFSGKRFISIMSFYFRISNIDSKIFDEKKLLCHIQNLKELLNKNVKIVEALSKLEICFDDEITDDYLQNENNDTLQL